MRLDSFSALKGETITAVEGLEKGSERVVFTLATGERFSLYHSQDCCESVDIEDVNGDPADLLGEVVLAEESSNSDDRSLFPDYVPESFTWTFYRLGTVKGTVVMRWLGESNGYYSEDVCWSEA